MLHTPWPIRSEKLTSDFAKRDPQQGDIPSFGSRQSPCWHARFALLFPNPDRRNVGAIYLVLPNQIASDRAKKKPCIVPIFDKIRNGGGCLHHLDVLTCVVVSPPSMNNHSSLVLCLSALRVT